MPAFGPSIDGGKRSWRGVGMGTPWRKFRITPEEDAALQAGAARYRVTVSAFIRIAVKALLTQRAVMSPEEVAAIDRARDQFQRAAVNLNSLLRQTYLFQSGVIENGPSEGELQFMADDLRQNAERLKLVLQNLPE